MQTLTVKDCPMKTVVLQGIHIALHIPTEERLTFQIQGLSPPLFRNLAVALEDWMVVTDDKYKEKATRGRSWKGRGRRVTMATRVRLLKFSPFPSRYSNILRTIRKELYYELHRHCLVLEGETHGGYKRNIYILPYANAPSFMNEINRRNREIDELNWKIEGFLKTEDYADLENLLKPFNVTIPNRSWKIEHVSFDATPLALQPAAVKQIVEDEYQRMFRKLEEDERQGLQALHDELERKRQELVVKAIENVQAKIHKIVKRIVATRKLKAEKVKKDLERLRRIAVSVGLDSIATSVIEPLAEVVDDPEKTFELFGTKDLSSAIDGRIRGLIESL